MIKKSRNVLELIKKSFGLAKGVGGFSRDRKDRIERYFLRKIKFSD